MPKIKNYIDVVIPVHNSAHWLSWCLEELFRFNSERLRSVYVVDDRSEYNQSIKIKEIVGRFADVVLIVNSNDFGGFGFACNLGQARCESEVVLFLNTDCLLTAGVLDRLCNVFDLDPLVALACPVSNNSPDLTYPMYPGKSYRDMSDIITAATCHSEEKYILEACTVVGNCLLVKNDFFKSVEGFSSEWGVGYGEETDLHMKALALGLKGVVHIGCYVYHFGGGTFNYEVGIEKHRGENYKNFMSKWGDEYRALVSRSKNADPLSYLSESIELSLINASPIIEMDVLFYLPGIDQGIGGLNAVVAICNDLVRMGLKVSCALVGITADRGLSQYKEPVLFNFLYYPTDKDFIDDCVNLPKVVFSTIFNSARVVAEFASVRGSIPVQFIQGYEGYFDNGQKYIEATDSYKYTKNLVTTSDWLFDMVKRHVKSNQLLQKLPLVVNQDIFFPGHKKKDIDIALIFRSGPDKGQWILAETLDQLVNSNKSILVFCSHQYSFLKMKYFGSKVEFVDLPIDQYSLAQLLRRVRIYLDASLHEGYGLIPLEAGLCGCNLLLSDSGGVRDFVKKFGGELIVVFPDPKKLVNKALKKLEELDSVDLLNTKQKSLKNAANWYLFVNNLCKNQPQPAFKVFRYSSKSLVEKLNSVNVGSLIVNFGSKVYRHIYRFIPTRLHLALKILVRGKL